MIEPTEMNPRTARRRARPRTTSWAAALLTPLLALLPTGCSGGSSGDGADELELVEISVQPNQVWQINRPIEFVFSDEVDFSTVNLNTIQIRDLSGRGAVGLFSVGRDASGTVDPRRVRFQPACPTREDFGDAGLRPGGVTYIVSVGADQAGGLSVRAMDGALLREGRSVPFRTPNGTFPQQVFQDPVPGPPSVRVRGAAGVGLDERNATYLELGGDPDRRVYFEQGADQVGTLPGDGMGNAFPVPLNHYSLPENRVAVVLHMDQPVQVSAGNLSQTALRLEYLDPRILDVDRRWVALPTRVELVANCTDTGAIVRLCPVGVLPQGASLRVNVTSAFADLAGNAGAGDRTGFAHMTTRLVQHPGGADPSRDADEVLETFLVGGELDESLEDVDAPLAQPRAEWREGRLRAGFAFEGSGGTNGTFDWIVPPGIQVTIDTVLDRITGGDGFIQGEQTITGGVIDVRNVIIPASSQVIFQGPNPVTLLASGTVDIGGDLVLSGGASLGVTTLNTASVPEPGALGRAGGGKGGTASYFTNQSTPRGGPGDGAFGRSGRGGEGGETSYYPTTKAGRRGAGGGGGRFGPDVFYPLLDDGSPPVRHLVRCQMLQGMDAEPGFPGGTEELGLGAVSQVTRAAGGRVGPGPFVDGEDENDFYGSLIVDPGGSGERLIRGELDRTWAGSGGGAGGDAVRSAVFPRVPFAVNGDEKGAGGGGGGGSLTILAIGDIVVREGGQILADGGRGAGGENSNFFDRIGGGSGGGSGGHIVLSSANRISISANLFNTAEFYGDPDLPESLNNFEHQRRPVSALGGRGGEGIQDWPKKPRWDCDPIPLDRLVLPLPGGGELRVPPVDTTCYNMNPGPPAGSPPGAGGDGGPGLIQLHVDSPAQNLIFPFQQQDGEVYGVDLDVTRALTPPPVGWHDLDDADVLLPFFGSESVAQSRWIRLGSGRLNPDPNEPGSFLADEQVQLRFGGTDGSGSLLRSGADVQLAAPILGPLPLGSGPNPPFVESESDGAVLVLDASGLAAADEIYKRNPALNRRLLVRFADGADPEREQLFTVLQAEYDGSTDRLRLSVDTSEGRLTEFVSAGPPLVSYLPSFFRVATLGVRDTIPAVADIAITFDATDQDASGAPNPALAYSVQDDGLGGANGFTGDIGDLNGRNWDFVRFRVFFDLNTAPGGGVNLETPRPSLEHLRIQLDY